MSIRTGAAQTDITPAGPVWMAGYGDRDRRSAGVYQPLSAGAIYLGGAADEVVLIAADLIGFGLAYAAQAKQRIAAATGMLPRQVVLTATHTHCGPLFYPMMMPGEPELEYAECLCERLVEVAVAARGRAVSGRVSFSRTRSGSPRRTPVRWAGTKSTDPTTTSACRHRLSRTSRTGWWKRPSASSSRCAGHHPPGKTTANRAAAESFLFVNQLCAAIGRGAAGMKMQMRGSFSPPSRRVSPSSKSENGILPARLAVLNAFRHQRFLHPRPLNETARTACAQRLSASKVSALDWGDADENHLGRCSTPFGIKGFCTQRHRPASRSRVVLNAFRHQRFLHSIKCGSRRSIQPYWCSTPFGIKGFCTTVHFVHSDHSDLCAQRLSASKVSAQLRSAEVQAIRLEVLNAFRHQRFLHWWMRDDRGQLWECSTPFGIKGFCTVRMQACQSSQSTMCSTPFGIKGFCTRHRR